MKSCTLFVCACMLSALLLPAAADRPSVFPETVRGRRAAAYFAAFNNPDESAMASFFNEHFSAAALQRAPVAERLARYRGFKKEARSLAPEKLVREADDAANYLVRSGQGELLEFTFQFEKDGEGKLIAILGAPLDPENAAELAGPPLGREEALARIRSILDEKSAADQFSGAVLVAQGDQVVLHEARGLASREYGVANTPDTRFNLGSINKVFTRVAIGQLCEKGRLALDDPLGKFLPAYPNREAAAKVTVRQLLDMTAGVGDFFGKKFAATPKDRVRTLEDYLQFFAAERLLFSPGSQRRYSNGGYIVLGLIVEKASGQDYFTYVHDHIYVPAGMTTSGHPEADAPETGVASGYTRDGDGPASATKPWRNNIYSRPARGSSAGGGYATAMDLFKFASALRSGKLLGPLGQEWFAGPQAYAGGAPGINAALEMDPVPGWTVVVMGNTDPPAASSLAQKIAVLLRRLR